MILIRFIILSAAFGIPVLSFSQNNITGIWNGKFITPVLDLGQPTLVVEIDNFKDSLFTGLTHLYYGGDKYEHYKIVGRYFKKDSLLLFTEIATLSVNLGAYINCSGRYMMRLSRKRSLLFLEGIWKSTVKECSPNSMIFLQKKMDAIITVPAPVKKKPLFIKTKTMSKPVATQLSIQRKIPAPVTIPAPFNENVSSLKAVPQVIPLHLQQRETDVQSLLEIEPAEKDSIKVEVYDNGEIDGDSVSVYEEDLQRISKKLITEKPITFYVSLQVNKKPITHLRLVAESLGTIPPCTALMIVTTKSKRYEVHLSSNFNKNATVELFLKQ